MRVLPREADEDEWALAERSRPAAGELYGGSPAMALWVKLLKDAAARRYEGSAEPSAGTPAMARRLGGCVMRLLLAAVFLFLALVAGLFLFGRSLLQSP
jgi:hypothetical protein